MNRFACSALAILIVLTWCTCACYLVFDQFLAYENRWIWLNWSTLQDLAGKALLMPLIIVISGLAALALIWIPHLLNRDHRKRSSIVIRIGLTLVSVVVSAMLWVGFQRAEHFIHLVAGTALPFQSTSRSDS